MAVAVAPAAADDGVVDAVAARFPAAAVAAVAAQLHAALRFHQQDSQPLF